MKIGIIAEYNPLHNGHVLHFNKIKEKYKDSTTIAIISSEFSQRGELTVFNKFQRASLALSMGVDLVLSNPIYTSMQQASTFAYTNVYYLNLAKVDKIIIGSESNDINLINEALEIINTNEFKDKIQELKEKGYSTKLSYTKALESFNLDIKSNDMLAIYYKDAINKINKNIELELVKREYSNYQDINTNSNTISSATYIRSTKNDITNYVPSYTLEMFKKYNFRNTDKLVPFIKKEALNKHNNLLEDTEGLSNKFTSLLKASNYNELVEILISKRYSESKINRLLISLLCDIEQFEYNINFIRVLGFNDIGLKHLNEIKKDVKIYTNIKDGINNILDLELKVSKILDIIYDSNLTTLELQGPIIC